MPFPSVAAGSFDRISPGSKHMVGSRFWPNCLSQCCVRRVSLTVPKYLVSDGRNLGLFVPLLPAVLRGFPQRANISSEAGFGRIVFLSAVFVVFHSRYQSTLIPVPPSISPS